MTSVRSTIGVVLVVPDPVGAEVAEVRSGLGDPLGEGIPTHITLLPPTPVGPQQYRALDEHLARVAQDRGVIRVHLRGTDTFRPVSDVVFLSLARGAQDCAALAAQVCSGPVATPSRFPYHPHVTLGHDLSGLALDTVQARHQDFCATFDIGEMVLYGWDDDGGWRVRSVYELRG